jgi:hypothetical protein
MSSFALESVTGPPALDRSLGPLALTGSLRGSLHWTPH